MGHVHQDAADGGAVVVWRSRGRATRLAALLLRRALLVALSLRPQLLQGRLSGSGRHHCLALTFVYFRRVSPYVLEIFNRERGASTVLCNLIDSYSDEDVPLWK